MKFVSVVGTRPNFVKLFPVYTELERNGFEHVVVNTGQHYDYQLAQTFFKDFNLPIPHYNLGVGSGTNGFQIGTAFQRLIPVLRAEKPDVVIAYGDSNAAPAAAMAATALHIRAAHVEAGLRSYCNIQEEQNRVLTDKLSSFNFVPTQTAFDNIKHLNSLAVKVGDVLFDLHKQLSKKAKGARLTAKKGFFLATVHRAENTKRKPLENIVAALSSLDAQVVLPLHPRTRKAIDSFGLVLGDNVVVKAPFDYSTFQGFLSQASLVLTDSGGVQKESFFFQRPCVVLRDSTEWSELVGVGASVLAGNSREGILAGVDEMLGVSPNWFPAEPLYGSGDAAEKIVSWLSYEVGK